MIRKSGQNTMYTDVKTWLRIVCVYYVFWSTYNTTMYPEHHWSTACRSAVHRFILVRCLNVGWYYFTIKTKSKRHNINFQSFDKLLCIIGSKTNYYDDLYLNTS